VRRQSPPAKLVPYEAVFRSRFGTGTGTPTVWPVGAILPPGTRAATRKGEPFVRTTRHNPADP
jgi:hypothetical protein